MQLLLIALVVSFLTGFLSSCKVSYDYYKVKDMKTQIAAAKIRTAILEKTVNEAEKLNEKAIEKKKEREVVYQEIIKPLAIAVPNANPDVCIDTGGMRDIKRLRN